MAVIFAGTGITPSRRAAPREPARTSGAPSPQAPRTCGAQLDQAPGRAIRAQAIAAGASEFAVHVRIAGSYPRSTTFSASCSPAAANTS